MEQVNVAVGSGVTATVTGIPRVPPAPMAVNVYVVVDVGLTVRLPVAATAPMPWSINWDDAPVTVQLRRDDPPENTTLGTAVNDTDGAEPPLELEAAVAEPWMGMPLPPVVAWDQEIEEKIRTKAKRKVVINIFFILNWV